MHKVVCVTPLRFCSPQFIVIMGWDAKDCRLEKAIRWGLGCGVGWGVQPAYLLYVQGYSEAQEDKTRLSFGDGALEKKS